MTPEQNQIFNKEVEDALALEAKYRLAVGYLRYEALRQLNPTQFAELYSRYLAGAQFDNMVDELVVKNAE
jgi:hypothetical protein